MLLAGISEVNDGRPQLHVGMASGPGFRPTGWLTSASTGRVPFAQLIDLAPTALRALSLDQPPSMNGQPLQAVGQRPELSAAVDELVHINVAATVHHRNVSTFFWVLVTVSALLVGLAMAVLGGWQRRPAPGRRAARWRGPLRVLALVAAALPAATYLAGLVPWEWSGSPVAALAVAVAVADLAVVVLALAGPWRRHRLGPPLVVLSITLGTLIVDVLTGSTLELNGLLGYDAIVAGRFTGYGAEPGMGLPCDGVVCHISGAGLLSAAAMLNLAGARYPADFNSRFISLVPEQPQHPPLALPAPLA